MAIGYTADELRKMLYDSFMEKFDTYPVSEDANSTDLFEIIKNSNVRLAVRMIDSVAEVIEKNNQKLIQDFKTSDY